MNYSDLSQETQLFLNKAMDVYSTIKDKSLNKVVEDLIDTKRYEFTKLDKKVLALFIAGFLIDGNINHPALKYRVCLRTKSPCLSTHFIILNTSSVSSV